MFRQNRWEKEWTALEKKEARYLMRRREEKTSSAFQQKLEEKIPEKLEETLNTAFIKAFDLVFEKGTGLIEKTYNKDQQKTDYQVREYAAGLKESRKTVKAFGRQSQGTRMKNLMISGVEGVGLGLLGIGLPDIPLFTAVILKSVYEIALSYGFEYESEKEQWFILKMIETALKKGEELERNNSLLNAWIDQNGIGETVKGRKEQSKETAAALAEGAPVYEIPAGNPGGRGCRRCGRYGLSQKKSRIMRN